MFEVLLPPELSELHAARAATRAFLGDSGIERTHIVVVEAVLNELVAAAIDAGAHTRLRVTVEPFRLLTSVRVNCGDDLRMRDEPFELRERVIEALTIAYGQRQHGDGTADLWAEVPRMLQVSVPAAS